MNAAFRNDTSGILAEIYRVFRETFYLYPHFKYGQCMFLAVSELFLRCVEKKDV
jgi:hypothetical protein